MNDQKLKRIIPLFLLAGVTLGNLQAQSPIEELAQAERDFAEYCHENGLPEAWVQYFSKDGFVFSPGPLNAHEQNQPRIPSPKPSPFNLHWEPYHGAVSESGDLGFNTGPWRITSNRIDTLPPLYGYFFSVWKKDQSGAWKVLLDLGVAVATAGPEHVFGAAYQERNVADTRVKNKANSAKEAEASFNKLASKKLLNAYKSFAASNIRSSINGFFPFDSREPLLTWLDQKNSPYFKKSVNYITIGFEPTGEDDFGYSYGSYEVSNSPEKGHYIRIWQKSASGKWLLVAEVCADNVMARAG